MKIERLPSGSFRARKTINGKTYSITLPYKPTKKEALSLLTDKATGADKAKMSFKHGATEYIDGKRNVLSPSTVVGYESLLKRIDDSFASKMMCDITPWDVQVLIDRYAKAHSPKTTRNLHGFISSVLGTFCPQTVLYTKLPQKSSESAKMPTDEDVRRLLSYAKGTEYEIPLRLACYGLRKSEVCALDDDDLQGNDLTISKAKVLNSERKWVIKQTKTESSVRTIYIDDDLAGLIREKGMYKGNPDHIYDFLRSSLKKLGIPHFPLHYLRHYYASSAHALGIPDAVIMASGGWKTDHVMKRVYRHAKDEKESQKVMADFIKSL